MSEPHRVGALEVSENISFQERQWKVQRIGWALMLLLIVLALVGLFSTWLLSAVGRATGPWCLSTSASSATVRARPSQSLPTAARSRTARSSCGCRRSISTQSSCRGSPPAQ